MGSSVDLPRLGHLRTFDTVARCGSMLGAAEQLNISQPAVSYAMGKLESGLRRKLLDRSAGGSFLTAAGQLFRNRTERLFRQLQEAVEVLLSPSGHDAARVSAIAWKLREPQIRALIAIWQSGGFRAAARRLDIAEPTLQRPARDLERLLRVSLYRRTALGFEVNPAGAELARCMAIALDEIRAGIEEIDAPSQSRRPNLRVGVLALSPRMILAEATSHVLDGHRNQRIEVVEGSYDALVIALRSGDVDLIFGALRTPAPYPGIVEKQLLEDPYAIVCRVAHPLHALRKIGPAELAGYDFVLPTEGLPRRSVLDRLLADWGIMPKGRIDTSCLATIVALLRATDRLSLLSRWHVDLDGWSDLRRLERVDVPHPPRFVGLTTRRGWLPTPFQQSFIDAVSASVARWQEKIGVELSRPHVPAVRHLSKIGRRAS